MAEVVKLKADIDISPGVHMPPVIDMSQYDAGKQIELTVYYDGRLMNLHDYYAALYGVKQDRHVFVYPLVCDEHTVTITTTPQMTAVAGDTTCEVRFLDIFTDTNIGTGNFILSVEQSPIQYAGDFSDDDIPGIIEISKAVSAAASAKVSEALAQDAAESAQDAADSIKSLTASATTLPEGSDATVTKTMTETGPNFDFGIPKGDTGEQGPIGPVGPVGPVGPKGDVPVVELTQAEYNELPDSERMKDILYCLTDGVPIASAEDVYYDNTESGIDAHTAQDAIDDEIHVLGRPDAFSESENYAEGDYCIHNNALYTCVSAVTAGSSFNPNEWTMLSLWDLINEPKVDMGTISSLPITKRVVGLPVGFEVKRFYLGTPSAQTSEWMCNTAWDAENQATTITITGTISGSTTLLLWFGPVRNLIAT